MMKRSTLSACALALGAVLATSAPLAAQHDDPHHARPAAEEHQPADHQPAAREGDSADEPYLLGTDPVTGEELGPRDRQVVLHHEGRELRFANEKNAEAFRKDPAKAMERVDAMVADQQRAHYPLETCIVSGEKLGGMGDPVEVVVGGRLYRLCCKGCKKDLAKNERAMRSKLDEALVAKEVRDYPMDTCLVSGEKLGADAIDLVMGGRLYRLCCKGCKKDLLKDPRRHLAMLDEHLAARHPERAQRNPHEMHGEQGARGERKPEGEHGGEHGGSHGDRGGRGGSL